MYRREERTEKKAVMLKSTYEVINHFSSSFTLFVLLVYVFVWNVEQKVHVGTHTHTHTLENIGWVFLLLLLLFVPSTPGLEKRDFLFSHFYHIFCMFVYRKLTKTHTPEIMDIKTMHNVINIKVPLVHRKVKIFCVFKQAVGRVIPSHCL